MYPVHPRFFASLLSLLCLPLALTEAADPTPVLQQRLQLDKLVWNEELLAQEHETAFIELWDQMRQYEDQADALINFEFNTLFLPPFSLARKIQEGVELYAPQLDSEKELSQLDFRELIAAYQAQGFRIEQSEWHHAKFERNLTAADRSEFSFALHIAGPQPAAQAYILRGIIAVAWQPAASGQTPRPDTLRLKKATLLTRDPTETFKYLSWLESKPNTTPYGIVLIEDINQDGLPDIAFPRRNALYLNKGNFQFEETVLASLMIRGLPTAAFFADLDLDGNLEYVLATHEAPFVFAYSLNPKTKAFDGKPFGIWKSDTPLQVGLLAAGDITGDGYPEIYLGQSAPIYENGKIPTPYFDANDGRPAFLLKNLRNLRFEDITEQSSIAQKRGRRAFTASFQDLNGDQRMDLLVTSDFSGIDIHENQNGTLVDKTDSYLAERSLFGMSHAFADFNRDGATDLLAVGMSSTTARRLEQMGLGREEFPEHQAMRMRIAKGNRLYYGGDSPALTETAVSEQIARSGWSWGNSTFDFNNDSYPDIYIANGYLSRSTARDYCSNFWTHDIYTESAFSPDQLDSFYTQFGPEALVGGGKMGWNPFEKDHLFLNLEGLEFVNVSYLFGLSHGGDGRATFDVDFDRDGKQDLLLVEQDSLNSLERVHLYRNQLPSENNWIAVQLQATAGHSLLGTKVIVETPGYTTERLYNLGANYSGQGPASLHFGLGQGQAVQRIKIIWPDGEVATQADPAINRYHTIRQD